MQDLRRYIAELLKAQNPAEAAAKSALAVANLAAYFSKNPPKMVGVYRNSEPNGLGEADPLAILKAPALAGAHFAFPRVVDRFNSEMDFAVPIHRTDWVKGVFGNPEPRSDLPAVEPHDFDAIVIPGVVFGLKGERIGRGAGFYDRYLMQASGALRIGFGYDFQLLNEPVPQADWDARMDVTVTELRTIETSGRSSI